MSPAGTSIANRKKAHSLLWFAMIQRIEFGQPGAKGLLHSD
jgi:hypothetical protein